jgi:peptidoglycan/xylan/chitin deacetylase (PgdA/CDA1 family)
MRASKSKPGRQPNGLFLFVMTCVTFTIFCVAIVLFYGEATRLTPAPQSKLARSINENLMTVAGPVPTPTPIPYPPKSWHCVKVPILMYHHVEPIALATKAGHAPLTVDSGVFASQMQYLSDHGYRVITLRMLSDFFDGKADLPSKPVVLTFDDGYSDFYAHALPILESHGYKSNLFVPTGLMENPGYLNWGEIKSASTRGVSIDHHTWSHANMLRTDAAFFHRELDIASQQLIERGYGPVTIFAYPYGSHDDRDIRELSSRGFTLAVTTIPGQMQCTEDRLALRRTRIGNQSLKNYGL